MKTKINGNDLFSVGYKEGKIFGIALAAVKQLRSLSKPELLTVIKKVRECPESYLDDKVLRNLASAIVEEIQALSFRPLELRFNSPEYNERSARPC